jgi:hypothetical protein
MGSRVKKWDGDDAGGRLKARAGISQRIIYQDRSRDGLVFRGAPHRSGAICLRGGNAAGRMVNACATRIR